jgi:uncharacterized protein Veg
MRAEEIASDPYISDVVYAQIGQKGIFRSRDGRRRWKKLNSGLIHNTYPYVHHPTGLAQILTFQT